MSRKKNVQTHALKKNLMNNRVKIIKKTIKLKFKTSIKYSGSLQCEKCWLFYMQRYGRYQI